MPPQIAYGKSEDIWLNQLNQAAATVQRDLANGKISRGHAAIVMQKIESQRQPLQQKQQAAQQQAIQKRQQQTMQDVAHQHAISKAMKQRDAADAEKETGVVQDHRTGREYHIVRDDKGNIKMAPWEEHELERTKAMDTQVPEVPPFDFSASAGGKGADPIALREKLHKHQADMAKKQQAFVDKRKKEAEAYSHRVEAAAKHFPVYKDSGKKNAQGQPIEDVDHYDMEKARAHVEEADRTAHPELFRQISPAEEGKIIGQLDPGQNVRESGKAAKYERIPQNNTFQHSKEDLEHEQFLKDQLASAGHGGLSAHDKSKLLLHFMDKEQQRDAQEAREAGRMARDHPRTIQDALLRKKLGLPMGGGQMGGAPQQVGANGLRRIGQGVQLRWDQAAGKEIREVPTTQGWMPEEEFNAKAGPKPKKSVQERAADAYHAHLAAIGEGPQQRPTNSPATPQQPAQDMGGGGDYGQQAQGQQPPPVPLPNPMGPQQGPPSVPLPSPGPQPGPQPVPFPNEGAPTPESAQHMLPNSVGAQARQQRRAQMLARDQMSQPTYEQVVENEKVMNSQDKKRIEEENKRRRENYRKHLESGTDPFHGEVGVGMTHDEFGKAIGEE